VIGAQYSDYGNTKYFQEIGITALHKLILVCYIELWNSTKEIVNTKKNKNDLEWF